MRRAIANWLFFKCHTCIPMRLLQWASIYADGKSPYEGKP